MNREIKFRAKDILHKEWYFGSLARDIPQNSYYIIDENYGSGVDVDENTVGQYTGLKDKNRKEIYEGDIIEFSYDVFVGNFDTLIEKGQIVFTDGAFYIELLDKDEWFLLYSVNIDTIEIIGNIYDNPELLGGE